MLNFTVFLIVVCCCLAYSARDGWETLIQCHS